MKFLWFEEMYISCERLAFFVYNQKAWYAYTMISIPGLRVKFNDPQFYICMRQLKISHCLTGPVPLGTEKFRAGRIFTIMIIVRETDQNVHTRYNINAIINSRTAHVRNRQILPQISFNTLGPAQNGRDIFNCIFVTRNQFILFKILLQFIP